jgi:hypothetical protein
MALGHALQDILKIGKGLHVVELGRGDEGTNGGPSLSATMGASERALIGTGKLTGNFAEPGLPRDEPV